MDPTTVIVVLALNLVSLGGLFLLIARRMPSASGLQAFGAGAATFGLAYMLRLAAGLDVSTPVNALADTAMVFAALLFIGGVRQFVGRPAFERGALAAALVAYVLVYAAVMTLWGMVARHVLLNLTLGSLYGLLAAAALRAPRHGDAAALRLPLRTLVVLMGALALATLARGLHIGAHGVEAVLHGRPAQLYYALASLIAVLLGPNLLWMVFVRLNGELAELASHDALTRALNRNGLDEALRRHFGARRREPITWLQVDIDHFKAINDAHGHAAGDAVLRAVATLLSTLVRTGDLVARTGGEEFLVGCIGADPATAQALGERLRAGVEALVVAAPGSGAPLRCTVSVGVSQPFAEIAQWEAAARSADRALYAAKAAGRNRVACDDVAALTPAA